MTGAFGKKLKTKFNVELELIRQDFESAEQYLIVSKNQRALNYAPAVLYIILPLIVAIFGGFDSLDILTVPLVITVAVMSWQMLTTYFIMIEGKYGTIEFAKKVAENFRTIWKEGMRIDQQKYADMLTWMQKIESGVKIKDEQLFIRQEINCRFQIEKLKRKLILCIFIAISNMFLNLLSWPVTDEAVAKFQWWVPLFPKYVQSLHIHTNLHSGESYMGLFQILVLIALLSYIIHSIIPSSSNFSNPDGNWV